MLNQLWRHQFPFSIFSGTDCCEAIIATCEACKKGTTVEDYCRDSPHMEGCEDGNYQFIIWNTRKSRR